MSIVGSEQWMYNSSTGFYPFTIDNSLRFNDDDTAFLSRTLADGGAATYTLSVWIKRANIGINFPHIYGAIGNSGDDYELMRFNSSDQINWQLRDSTVLGDVTTDAVFRDVSAWYNIVFYRSGSTVKIYVNGVEQTLTTGTSYSSTVQWANNNTYENSFGVRTDTQSGKFDGYMAEINFIDGSALTPASFGETKEGIWVAKDTSGLTYGANGFRLQFKNSATGTASSSTVGADTGGNNLHFTSSGIATTDNMLDSPNINFAVMNSLDLVSTGATLSDGNLTWTIGGADGTGRSNFVMTSGKWYAEAGVGGAVSDYIGVISGQADITGVNGTQTVLYAGDGTKRVNGSSSSYGASFASTDIIGIALDLDSGTQTVEFFKNNASQGSINLTDVGGEGYSIGCGSGSGSRATSFNFGQDSTGISSAATDENGIGTFEYAPPSGFLALCTANFPDPSIDPANGENPTDYFGSLLWSGDDNASRTVAVGQSGVTGDVNFTPDFTWVKRRNGATNGSDHMLLDVVRGVGTFNALSSNGSQAEGFTEAGSAWANFGDIASFTTDGFVVKKGSDSSHTLEGINQSGGTYVAWNWKAGTSFSNDASATGIGTIDSTGSVSTEAGFSIVSYQGNGTDDATVKHGLSQKPELCIIKNLGASTNWDVSFEGISGGTSLNLDTDASVFSPTLGFHQRGTQVLTLKDGSSGRTRVNTNSQNYIAYCFYSVDGYSKISTYKGNGSADGTFVFTGFRPAWLLVKRVDGGSENWNIVDNKRNSFNGAKSLLFASASSVEADATNGIDLLSNGFKVRDNIGNYNTGSADYLYMAFADQPLKYSNAR